MGFVLRGFMRYAGAPSVAEMRKTQAAASIAMRAGEVYEKPADSPDRPENITRALREGTTTLPADLPDNIEAAAKTAAKTDQAALTANRTPPAQPLPPESSGGGTLLNETA